MKLFVKVALLSLCIALAQSASVYDIFDGNDGASPSPTRIESNDLTEKQQYLLDKFRLKVDDLLTDKFERTDTYLLGWLLSITGNALLPLLQQHVCTRICFSNQQRIMDWKNFFEGTKWNLYAAEQMLKRNIQSRIANKVDELGKEEISKDMQKLFPYRVTGKDLNGCLVVEVDFNKWDFSGYIFSQEFPRDAATKIHKHFLQMFGKFQIELRKSGGKCQQYTFLTNLDGLSMDKFADIYSISAITKAIRSFMNYNYANDMKILIGINAPSNFKDILEMFKPVLPDFFVRKLNFYPKEEDWRPILLSNIDKSELSPAYGGTKSLRL